MAFRCVLPPQIACVLFVLLLPVSAFSLPLPNQAKAYAEYVKEVPLDFAKSLGEITDSIAFEASLPAAGRTGLLNSLATRKDYFFFDLISNEDLYGVVPPNASTTVGWGSELRLDSPVKKGSAVAWFYNPYYAEAHNFTDSPSIWSCEFHITQCDGIFTSVLIPLDTPTQGPVDYKIPLVLTYRYWNEGTTAGFMNLTWHHYVKVGLVSEFTATEQSIRWRDAANVQLNALKRLDDQLALIKLATDPKLIDGLAGDPQAGVRIAEAYLIDKVTDFAISGLLTAAVTNELNKEILEATVGTVRTTTECLSKGCRPIDVLSTASKNLQVALKSVVDDPPDSNYGTVSRPISDRIDSSKATDAVAREVAETINQVIAVTAHVIASRQNFEKYQGAYLAGDYESAKLHLDAFTEQQEQIPVLLADAGQALRELKSFLVSAGFIDGEIRATEVRQVIDQLIAHVTAYGLPSQLSDVFQGTTLAIPETASFLDMLRAERSALDGIDVIPNPLGGIDSFADELNALGSGITLAVAPVPELPTEVLVLIGLSLLAVRKRASRRERWSGGRLHRRT